MAEQSLKDKTVKGTIWSAADVFLSSGVSFIVGIILARLLTPEEYGLLGICIIVNTVLEGFVDSGFSTAIIRKVDANEDDYNTMFHTNMLISVLLYGVLFFVSPWVADFFDRNELVDIIRVSGLVILINALSLTQNAILTKNLNFKAKTKASLLSSILSGIVGVCMACFGYGVWSLVAQLLIKSLLNTVCLWIINKWWPSLTFSIDSLKYLWGFGWKLLIGGMLDRIWREIYQLVVGKYYNPATLGQYTRSKSYASMFSQNINNVIMRVSFPVLSSIQNDKEKMVVVYRRVIKQTMFVSALSMMVLAAIAEPMIFFLIGEKWKQAASFLPLICISMSLYPLHALNLNMLKVLGRSDLFLIYEIIKKVLAIGPICLGIFVGIYWMLFGSIIVGVLSFFVNSWYTGKQLHYTSWMQLKDVAYEYIIGICIALTVYFFKYLPLHPGIILLIQVIVAACECIVICELFKVEEYIELKNIVVKILKKE